MDLMEVIECLLTLATGISDNSYYAPMSTILTEQRS